MQDATTAPVPLVSLTSESPLLSVHNKKKTAQRNKDLQLLLDKIDPKGLNMA